VETRNLVWLGLAVLAANAIRFAPAAGGGGQISAQGPIGKPKQPSAADKTSWDKAKLAKLPDDNPFVLLCSQFLPPETVRDVPNPVLIPPFCQTETDALWTPENKTGYGTFTNRFRFLIATVPDPEETHLTLLFDRMVASIQRAAEDSGYSFDIHWLPWHTPESVAKEQEESDPDVVEAIRLRRAERTRFPGLLLFRKATGQSYLQAIPVFGSLLSCFSERSRDDQSYLAVFLIGESPISGIDRTQMANALAYIPLGSSPPPPILGPAFSGSEASLQQSLSGCNHGDILSGTATGLKYRGSSTQHNDTFAMKELLFYLSRSEDEQSLIHLALIREGATEYGSTLYKELTGDKFKAPITEVSFPKDIARLRNAYEEHQLWAKPQSGSPSPSTSPGLTLKLKDDPGGRDSVPAYSTSQTPLAQDAWLSQITAILKLDNTETAGVMATDVLDTIFLMRYLHVSSPDLQIFTLDSDLLLARSGDSISLLGTLAATTYPLFPASQDWTSADWHPIFDSALSEGTFNAMQSLLDEGGRMSDYSRPFRRDSHVPPLWLMVVARHGYRPVALLDDGKTDDMLKPSKVSPALQDEEQPVSRAWALAFLSIAILSAIWVIVIIVGQFQTWRVLKDFRLSRREGGPADRAAILSVGTAALACLMLVAFSAPRQFAAPKAGAWIGMLVLGIAVLAALLMLLGWLVRKSFKALASRRIRSICLSLSAVAGFLAFALCWIRLLWSDGRLQSFFFVVRGVDLVSGVSPFLPFFLMLPAFPIWAWFALQRKIFIAQRRPKLPGDGQWPEGLSPDQALKPISSLSGLAHTSVDEAIVARSKGSVRKGAVLFVALGGLVFIEAALNIRSVERTTFDWIFRAAIALLAGTVFLALGKFLFIWHRLRLWLEQVELHPLRQAFSLLPPNKGWSPLWVRQIRKRSYVITARSLETLECLVEHSREPEKMPPELKVLAARVFEAAGQGKPEPREASRKLRTLLGTIAGWLQTRFLEPKWNEGCSEALCGLAASEEWKDTLKREKKDLEAQKPFILASEFVAWRYIAYIRYVTLHLENLLAFMSFGFILIVLSLSSYPFVSQRLIGWLIGVMFAILGIGIVRVYAQMDRDATLSRITKTESGKLGGAFYLKLASFGALPILALLSAYFPTIGSFLGSLVQPAVQALH
jgi:hypothetical protein